MLRYKFDLEDTFSSSPCGIPVSSPAVCLVGPSVHVQCVARGAYELRVVVLRAGELGQLLRRGVVPVPHQHKVLARLHIEVLHLQRDDLTLHNKMVFFCGFSKKNFRDVHASIKFPDISYHKIDKYKSRIRYEMILRVKSKFHLIPKVSLNEQ